MNAVSVIELGERYRIVVDYDPDPESPREWDDKISVHPLTLNRSYVAPSPGEDAHGYDLDVILENADHSMRSYGVSDSLVEAVTKHFDRAGVPFVIAEQSSYRDWVGHFVWYADDSLVREAAEYPSWDVRAVIEGSVKTYQAWASGEVYHVAYQRLETWVKDGTDETREEWETVDSVGGVYMLGDDAVRYFWSLVLDLYLDDEARAVVVEKREAGDHPLY